MNKRAEHYSDLLDPEKAPDIDYSDSHFGVFSSGGTNGVMTKVPKRNFIFRWFICSHTSTTMRQKSTGGGFMADVHEYEICIVCGATVKKKKVW